MYKEERIIDGVLCWRGSPDGEFQPYTIEEISNLYESTKIQLNELCRTVEELQEQLNQRNDSNTNPLGDLT